MAKDPAFLFYPSDFNDGTQDFTNEEVGAYLRLLLFQFSQGRLPLDRIKRKLGSDFERLWPVLAIKFQIDEQGCFYNARLENEVSKRKAFSESRRNNIKKRYEKEVNNTSSTYVATSVVHMENENENRNEDVNTDTGKGLGENQKPISVPIETRKQVFFETLKPYISKYGQEMINRFYDYWTETNESGKKFRQESEKFWDLPKRLATWHSRNQKFVKAEPQQPKLVFANGRLVK
jgi:uncharacterized protein YdaU (DUF1376 family)